MSKYSGENMDSPGKIYLYVFIVVIVVLVTLTAIYFIVPEAQVENSDAGPWVLEDKPGMPDNETFTKNVTATLRVFYYIDNLPRTNTNLLEPSTSFNTQTNTYDICEPTSTNTCQHPGFVKLLSLGSSFYIEVLQAPDASRPGLPKTQMVIQTRKNVAGTNAIYLETFALPEFPIQKWVMLTLVRNGNRFSVFYNDQLVFSRNTTNIPYIENGGGMFSDPGVRGKTKYFFRTDKAFSLSQVRSDYAKTADTRGKPIEQIFQTLNYTFCPSGDCFSGPRIRPANPLIEWSSDVM